MEVGLKEPRDGSQMAQKEQLVYDGLLYHKTSMNPDQMRSINFTKVIAREEENDESEPNEAGPDLVIFEHALYRKSITHAADIEDHILRTVASSIICSVAPSTTTLSTTDMPVYTYPSSSTSYPVSPHTASTLTYSAINYPRQLIQPTSFVYPPPPQDQPSIPYFDRIQLPPPQLQHKPLGYSLHHQPTQPQYGQLNAITPLRDDMTMAQAQRIMPVRSRVTDSRRLQYLFDLPINMRHGFDFRVPARDKPAIDPLRIDGVQVTPRRYRWSNVHKAYLDELMELAMLTLNRPLAIRDFPAITEALHRRFEGTIPIRGYNTIHSHATRRPGYAALLTRMGF